MGAMWTCSYSPTTYKTMILPFMIPSRNLWHTCVNQGMYETSHQNKPT